MPQDSWFAAGNHPDSPWFTSKGALRKWDRSQRGHAQEGGAHGGPPRDGPYGGRNHGKGGKGGHGGGKKGWHPPPEGGRPPATPQSWGGGGDWSRDRRPANHRNSPWSLVHDAAATARCVVEAARDLRYLAAPHAAQQGQDQGAEAGKGWLATARDWLLGDAGLPATTAGPQQLALTAGAAPAPASTPAAAPLAPAQPVQQGLPADQVQLLAKLLGNQPPDRSSGSDQAGEVAALKAQLDSQNRLLQHLTASLAGPAGSAAVPAAVPPALPAPAPAAPDPASALLLQELVRTQVKEAMAGQGPGAAKPAEDAPKTIPSGVLPTRASLDPEGEVTPEGHDAFWQWLDNTPSAPWPCTGAFSTWVDKVAYKCKAEELREWAKAKGVLPVAEQPPSTAPTRRELVVMLAKASVASAGNL